MSCCAFCTGRAVERTEPGYPVCSLERHTPSSLGPVWGLTRCFRAPPHLPTCTLDTAIQNTSGTSGKVFTPRQLSPNPASSCCFQSIPTLGREQVPQASVLHSLCSGAVRRQTLKEGRRKSRTMGDVAGPRVLAGCTMHSRCTKDKTRQKHGCLQACGPLRG